MAVVKAASGKHPPAVPGFDASTTLLHLTKVAPMSLAAVAATPFESALREVALNLHCVNNTNRSTSHERVTLTLKLEPLTEYIVDLEAQPAVGNASYPMLRRNFATSRYPDMPAFAADIAAVEVVHRHLANPGSLAVLAAANPGGSVMSVSDAAFEDALRAVRWGDLKRPAAPRVTVIWQGGGAQPQPFAVFIETTEPLWRSRGLPELVLPSAGDADGIKRYQLVDRGWLELIETSPGPARVSCFVHSTEGARTLAILHPGARGSTLQLSLRRTTHKLFEGTDSTVASVAATVNLTKAPWEDES